MERQQGKLAKVSSGYWGGSGLIIEFDPITFGISANAEYDGGYSAGSECIGLKELVEAMTKEEKELFLAAVTKYCQQ